MSILFQIKRLGRDTRAATAIEYGLIAALIAVAAITALSSVGTSVKKTFGNVSTKLNASAT
jgi:pilus assembly protein Flp/PilA